MTWAKIIYIALDPCPAPRQSRRDIWKPSPQVIRYRSFKDSFMALCIEQGLNLMSHPCLSISFGLAMSSSWSKKRRSEMLGKPHQQKPDLDNLCKAVLDASGIDDSHVHTLELSKVWSEEGYIQIGIR